MSRTRNSKCPSTKSLPERGITVGGSDPGQFVKACWGDDVVYRFSVGDWYGPTGEVDGDGLQVWRPATIKPFIPSEFFPWLREG